MIVGAALMVLAAENAGPDVYSPLLQYGAVGAMLVVILFFSAAGILYWRPSVDWLRERIKQQQDLNDNLLESNQKAIPALGEAVSAMRSMADALSELRREQASTREEVKRLREDLDRLTKRG